MRQFICPWCLYHKAASQDTSSSFHLVLEYCDGGNLEDLLELICPLVYVSFHETPSFHSCLLFLSHFLSSIVFSSVFFGGPTSHFLLHSLMQSASKS